MPYVEKLKVIRDEKKITNVDISKISNIPLATVTRVFNGQTPNPTFETISRIALALGMSLDELIGLKEPNESPITPPIETALNSYSELLQEKDERIKELKEEKERERKDRHRMTCVLICVVGLLMALLAFDLINGQVGYFRR